MRYGSVEYQYAEPFANALLTEPDFRAWVLKQTKFASHADCAVPMHKEMAARRSNSQTWWRSHYTEKCRCEGCSGQETDILAVFKVDAALRFAVHFEVKQPKDKFSTKRDQASNYAIRAKCWSSSPPAAVVPHSEATTVLVCSETKLEEYEPHLPKFDAVITFEEIARLFPYATAPEIAFQCTS